LRQRRGPHPYRFGHPPASPLEALCAARQSMWQSHIVPGNRNNVAIRLASAFRIAGYSQAEALALLGEWNHRQRLDLPESEVRGVARSAYARPYPYNYGCFDEVIQSCCPYVGRWQECDDYREHHPRSGGMTWDAAAPTPRPLRTPQRRSAPRS